MWYVQVRWLFLLAIAIPGVLSNFIGEGYSAQVKRDFFLGILVLASNGVFYLYIRRQKGTKKYYRNLTAIMLLVDILTITILIFMKGGIESRSLILYTIPLLVSSALFGQKGVYYTAGLSIGLYNLMIVADFTGIIHSIGAVNPGLSMNGTYVLNTVTFFTSVLIIIALLADFITRLLGEQTHLASQNQHELEEAQRSAKIGSWTWDITTNKVSWSKQLQEMFGMKPKNFGATFEGYLDNVHTDDKTMVQRVIQRSLKAGTPFAFDHRIIKDKNTIWLHSYGQITLKEGVPVKMIGTAQDITGIKDVEQELERRNQELEDTNKLMIGRELRMIELKKQIEELKQKLSGKLS